MPQPPISDQLIEIDRCGRKMPIYIASPEGEGPYPAVIVVHEIFGLNDHIKDIARRFAREGFVAYAPDLFEGNEGMPADRNDLNAMRAVWAKIPDATLISDLQSVLTMAQLNDAVRSDKVGTIGYCMGGAIAYMLACSSPSVAWVADYYGRIYYPQLTDTKPKHPIDYTDTLPCPVIGLFAGVDELITAEHVEELKQRISATGKPNEIKIYDGAKHAFFNDQREFYNKDAADDAWKRTLEFVGRATQVPR
jgi:carboxymethylenebutenolidase